MVETMKQELQNTYSKKVQLVAKQALQMQEKIQQHLIHQQNQLLQMDIQHIGLE